LLKRKAKQEGMSDIKKHATLPGTRNMAMVNENILSSSHLNAIYSIATTNVLKLALFSEKKKLYPLPHCSRLIRR
jgi:hypothetical protein